MSWDNAEVTPAETGGGQWNPDEFAAPTANEFESASYGGANGGGGGSVDCVNCGEEGHMKVDCPNPAVAREFTGTCRSCGNEGHRAADCPDKLPQVCNNCKADGHVAFECKSPRKVEYPGVEDIPGEVAWDQMKVAAEEHDLDDVLDAGQRYLKATPDLTYQQLESAFRSQNVGIYLIAIEKELTSTYTNMDLQGNLDKTYSVTWRFDPKPLRLSEKDKFAASPEENLQRLADAGTPVDRRVPKCSNCDELGHTFKACPQEKQENADKAVVKCYNCEEIGHRVRDCPNPRPDKFACRNCKQSGHSSKECPEPRSAEGVECKKCNETGHFAKDCPQGGGGGGGACHNCGEEGHRKQDCTNERKLICRNCDEEGHTGRECPKPRDYSRVKCQNCNEMGHTKVRCKQPTVEEAGGNDGGYEGGYGGDTNGEAPNAFKAFSTIADWEAPAATQEVAGGGWETQGGSSW